MGEGGSLKFKLKATFFVRIEISLLAIVSQ